MDVSVNHSFLAQMWAKRDIIVLRAVRASNVLSNRRQEQRVRQRRWTLTSCLAACLIPNSPSPQHPASS